MKVDRRRFAAQIAALAAVSSVTRSLLAQEKGGGPLFVATWDFGLPACEKALGELRKTGSLLDAVEQGIRVAEADETNSSVGVGGAPNADGVVQLDACIMDGVMQRAGSVAGLENYPHPISVARRVMEKTRHVMLVGDGAARFAREQGFEVKELLTEEQRKKWREWRAKQAASEPVKNHDTIALVGLDDKGSLAGGCSTSGLAYKLPGRVGDSPLIGGGLYVDGEVGAAGATGVGENILRYCGSFLIVEFMRGGMDPAAACVATIKRIARREKKSPRELSINFLAIDRQGRWGAAGTDEGYQYAVVTRDSAKVHKPIHVTSAD